MKKTPSNMSVECAGDSPVLDAPTVLRQRVPEEETRKETLVTDLLLEASIQRSNK